MEILRISCYRTILSIDKINLQLGLTFLRWATQSRQKTNGKKIKKNVKIEKHQRTAQREELKQQEEDAQSHTLCLPNFVTANVVPLIEIEVACRWAVAVRDTVELVYNPIDGASLSGRNR